MTNKETCKHENMFLDTSGGDHFSAGEVWDDKRAVWVCPDCGEEWEE